MIPTIETICEDLKAGRITVQEAIGWLYQHAEGSVNDLRDHFAAQALPACYAQVCAHCEQQGFPEGWRSGVADDAYKMADAMLTARRVDSRCAAPKEGK